jgi:hypothetical protein
MKKQFYLFLVLILPLVTIAQNTWLKPTNHDSEFQTTFLMPENDTSFAIMQPAISIDSFFTINKTFYNFNGDSVNFSLINTNIKLKGIINLELKFNDKSKYIFELRYINYLNTQYTGYILVDSNDFLKCSYFLPVEDSIIVASAVLDLNDEINSIERKIGFPLQNNFKKFDSNCINNNTVFYDSLFSLLTHDISKSNNINNYTLSSRPQYGFEASKFSSFNIVKKNKITLPSTGFKASFPIPHIIDYNDNQYFNFCGIFKLNSNLDTLFAKRFQYYVSGVNLNYVYPKQLIPARNNNFIGLSYFHEQSSTFIFSAIATYKFDSTGTKIWDSFYYAGEPFGIIEAPDDGVIVLVRTYNSDPQIPWNYRLWLYKLNHLGTNVGLKEAERNGEDYEYSKNENKLTIYPNPANDKITISSEQLEKGEVEIYNSLGMKVLYHNLPTNRDRLSPKERSFSVEIDISALPKGMYAVKVGSATKKFVIE